MSHYPADQWADYARGLLPETETGEMRRHLERGCARCGPIATALERVARLAATESAEEPPSGVLRSVKALGLVAPPAAPARAPLGLRLLYDSLTAADAAGVRGANVERRLSFAAGDLELELELRADAVGEGLRLAGELADGRRGPLPEVPAFLLRGGEVVDLRTTDELGSFRLAAASDERLRLCLFPGDDRVELALEPPGSSGRHWSARPGGPAAGAAR